MSHNTPTPVPSPATAGEATRQTLPPYPFAIGFVLMGVSTLIAGLSTFSTGIGSVATNPYALLGLTATIFMAGLGSCLYGIATWVSAIFVIVRDTQSGVLEALDQTPEA